MPYYRKRRRYARRRRIKRFRGRRTYYNGNQLGFRGQFRNNYRAHTKQSIRVIKGIGEIMPDKLVIPLKWMAKMNSVFTGTGSQDVIIAGNSLLDPGDLLAQVQPQGLDQLGRFYEHYIVYGSSIDVNLYKNTVVSNRGFQLVVYPLNGNMVETNNQLAMVRPYARTATMGHQQGKVRVQNSMTTKKMYGESFLNQAQYGGDTPKLGVSVGVANVDRLWYWHMFVFDISSIASVAFDLPCQVTLTLKCIFMKKRPMLGSTRTT